MPQRLTNLVIDRVDLVDKGANQHAAIVLAKRLIKKDPSVADVHVDVPVPKKKTPSQELKEKNVKKVSKLRQMLEDIFKEAGVVEPPAAPHEGQGLHPDHVAALKAHHENLGKMIAGYGDGPHAEGHPVHAMKAAHAEIGKALAGCPADTAEVAEPEEPMSKEDPVMAKRLADIDKRNVDLQKQLDDERDLRLNGEMVGILKSFKATPFNIDLADPKNDVVKMRKMKTADPEAFDRMIAVVKSQDAEIEKSALFQKDLGSRRTGTTTAEKQLQAIADGLITKGAEGMTPEKAFAKACEDNPALVRQMRKE